MKLEAIAQPWYCWQKILFRFFFIFYFIFIGPLFVLSYVVDLVFYLPFMPQWLYLPDYWYNGLDAIVNFCNNNFFHIAAATKPPNGNGDYPEQWMLVFTCFLLAVVGTICWSIIDRKRKDYYKLNYWFSLFVRYFIAVAGIQYGFYKLFALQMPFPSLSQMATPLGDYLPMRFSWMFIGYSNSYQFFSGAIELLAALLLLFRRTATFGVLVATGVFLNVAMLNVSYDIPVKINSISLVILCLYLLAQETPRLYRFFFRQEARASKIFVFPFETRKGKIVAGISKWAFVTLVLFFLYQQISGRIDSLSKRKMPAPITAGIYDVISHSKGEDTITVNMPDSVYWQNIVFDLGYEGSIKTNDTRFRQRYGRCYFNFDIDSAANLLSLKRNASDTVFLAQFKYTFKDKELVELYSYPREDSMYLLLRKRTNPFPLSERPFHWISETNR
ncbi:MAG TPA: hypothetical protein VFU29_25215 [Chitinophagaceae bacterium]|nr:hypothetical protein [Chitinophagaceae bacterium]